MKRKFLILIGALFLLTAIDSRAEEQNVSDKKYNLGEVLVSATKTEGYQAETGSSSTVITADDLKKTGKETVLEVLRDVPGVSIMQYGSFGASTSIYLRGSKPGHTLVMLDGIELNDPMGTDRSFNFANLLIDNIKRIEIVRGAQSTLYGSDAMGGVINIITKKGEGNPKWEASFEGGAHNTFKETLGFSGALNKLSYSLSLLRLDTDGVSKAAGGSEDDGYKNTTFSTRLAYALFENANLDLVLRRVDAEYDYDDGANQDDPNKVGWWESIMGKIAFDQSINSTWDHKISFSYAETERKYRDDPDSVDTTDNAHNWYNGQTKKFEWQHNFYPVDWSKTTAGFEYEEERGFSDGRASWNRFDRKTMDNKGYYLQNRFKLLETLFITPGLRVDDNEFFGAETTYKISGSYLIADTGTRLKANWGTGFKAPSLYQLYSSYGDPNLNPDKGKSYDFGFEQNLFDDRAAFGLTYFHNEFKDMVDFDMASYTYQNIDNAKMKGLELEGSFKPSETLTLGINYTYTKTEDEDTGNELARRPKSQAGFNINWEFLEKGNLNLSASYVGSRWDNSANTGRSKAYTKVDLYTSYDLVEGFQVFGRAENLFDKTYQQIPGYAALGRSFYAGIKTAF